MPAGSKKTGCKDALDVPMKLNDLPSHDIPALDGNNAPVATEDVFENMPVIGKVPADLNGLYVRNGPNPF